MSYRIGVLGDDAKTEFILVNPEGEIRGRATCIGCNPDIFLDQDTIRSVLLERLLDLAAQAEAEQPGARIDHTALCMPGSPGFWTGIVARLHEFSPASSHANFTPALELATGGKPGLLIDCGDLRSVVAARGQDLTVHHAGNLGCRLNDPGSNYSLGCQALTRTLAELQGWSEPSALGRSICADMKSSDAVLLTTRLDGPSVSNQQIADLAEQVFDLASKGDAVAASVMHSPVSEIADLAHSVRESLFGDDASVPIGLHGRILQSESVREILQEALGTKSRFVPITGSTTEGLRQMLVRLGR